jgi:hypothetical protein
VLVDASDVSVTPGCRSKADSVNVNGGVPPVALTITVAVACTRAFAASTAGRSALNRQLAGASAPVGNGIAVASDPATGSTWNELAAAGQTQLPANPHTRPPTHGTACAAYKQLSASTSQVSQVAPSGAQARPGPAQLVDAHAILAARGVELSHTW